MASKQIDKEIMAKIGGYILDGMSEREACILSDVDPADLTSLKERSEDIVRFLNKKFIEFKHVHIKEIQTKKSEKNSMWLLEKVLPDEFGSKAQKQEGQTVNIIKAIINNIQNDNSGQSIVSPIRRGDVASGNIAADDDGIPIIDIGAVLK